MAMPLDTKSESNYEDDDGVFEEELDDNYEDY
jgi:hypothetical protein